MSRDKNRVKQTFTHAACALELIPIDTPAMALMRHAERYGITKGHHGNDIPLTPQGEKDAAEMGNLLQGRVCGMRHSPVPRCLQTAARIHESAGGPVPEEWLPLQFYAFLDDVDSGMPTLHRFVSKSEPPGFYDRFVSAMSTSIEPPYPGFKSPLVATVELCAQSLIGDGICVNITHDWLVNVVASHASGQETKQPDFAGYLDALFLWTENGQAMFYYKGETGLCASDFQRQCAGAILSG